MKRLYAVAKATAIVLYLYGTGSSAELSTENQAKLLKSVDSYAPRMSEVALKIWSKPELGYQEIGTSALLQDELKKAGFKIEAGVAGIPTAFVVSAGTNDGPVIAILAEIDALPACRKPRCRNASRFRIK
jgi:aminobenzoyl-glutamate utilization protein B